MICTRLILKICLFVLTFNCLSAEQRTFPRGPFTVRRPNGYHHPFLRYHLRFIGKREDGYNPGNVNIHDEYVNGHRDKRYLPENTETKLKVLERVLQDIRELEVAQDNDFRLLLEKHKEELKGLFRMLPPFVNRRLFHSFLSSLIKRRIGAWAPKPGSDKRPSFNAWGGKRKRVDNDLIAQDTDEEDTAKHVPENTQRFTGSNRNAEIMRTEKRPSFNAWGGKRNEDVDNDWSDSGTNTNAENSFDTQSDVDHELSIDEGPSFDSWSRIEGESIGDKGHSDYEGIGSENGIDPEHKRSFNAWGGKRNNWPSRNSIGGKRANFNPWGGKRGLEELASNKRGGFNAWGGKRVESTEYDDGHDINTFNSEADRNRPFPWPQSFVNIEYDTFYPTE